MFFWLWADGLAMPPFSSRVVEVVDGPSHPPLDSLMLLKLAVNRIRLQKKKYREINENRKREVASLLQQEKELQARVKVASFSR